MSTLNSCDMNIGEQRTIGILFDMIWLRNVYGLCMNVMSHQQESEIGLLLDMNSLCLYWCDVMCDGIVLLLWMLFVERSSTRIKAPPGGQSSIFFGDCAPEVHNTSRSHSRPTSSSDFYGDDNNSNYTPQQTSNRRPHQQRRGKTLHKWGVILVDRMLFCHREWYLWNRPAFCFSRAIIEACDWVTSATQANFRCLQQQQVSLQYFFYSSSVTSYITISWNAY